MMIDPKQEAKLLELIRENAPDAPKAPLNEEALIWNRIERSRQNPLSRIRNVISIRPWAYPLALAALLAAILIPRWISSPSQAPTEQHLTELEAYLHTTVASVYSDMDSSVYSDWAEWFDLDNGG